MPRLRPARSRLTSSRLARSRLTSSRLARLRTAVFATALAGSALAIPAGPAAALSNGLARTPPMGWNDWNAFHCDVSASLVEKTADTIVSAGLRDAGYRYVNIDDCWAAPNRDASGNLVPNPTKFPDGIKAVADYVHARGLKLGIYEDSGTHTCSKSGGFSGSLGHEQQDALLFAQWGVDYLKYDDCNIPSDGQNQAATIQRYDTMRDALATATAKTGHPIAFSICEKTDYGVPNSAWPTVGNLWRTTFDIKDNYQRMLSIFHINVQLSSLASPGAWNDPDMLEIGNGGMTTAEYQTEFSLWSEMAAPLIAGTDLTKASSATLAIYTNRAVIGVDQDSLGRQGYPVADSNGAWVLTKPLAGGDRAVVLFNETDATQTITTTAAQVGLSHSPAYALHDLWSGKTTETAGTISAQVAPHATVMYRVTPGAAALTAAPDATVTMDPLASLTPGTPAVLTESVTDNGRTPVLFPRLALSLPAGWTATPLPAGHDVVIPPGKTISRQWQVSEAATTPPGATITATAGYYWPTVGAVTATDTQPVPAA